MIIELVHPVTNVVGEIRFHDDSYPSERSVTALIDSCIRNDIPFRAIIDSEMHMFGPEWLRSCMVRFYEDSDFDKNL